MIENSFKWHLPSVRTSWAWWCLFQILQLLLFPTGTLKASNCALSCSLQIFIVLILGATFCGIIWNFLQLTTLLKGDGNYEKAEQVSLLFFFLLVLIIVADVLQLRHFQEIGFTENRSNLPQFSLVLGLPYVVCKRVESSFKLQKKMNWNFTPALLVLSQEEKDPKMPPIIPQLPQRQRRLQRWTTAWRPPGRWTQGWT